MTIENQLLNPELTESYVLFVMMLLGLILYAGMQLYSVFVVIAWSISVIVFVGVGVYDLPIMIFYLSIIVNVLIISLASIRFVSVK